MSKCVKADARRVRRRRVDTPLVSVTLPLDIMAIVCQYLHGSPRHVFLSMKAAKGLRVYLDSEWWKRFWDTHRVNLRKKLSFRHYFLRDFTIRDLRPVQYAHVLRLVYGLRCECCGTRWRHRIDELMKLRICVTCVQERFISNRVLYYVYGLNASDILMENSHLISYVPLADYRRSQSSFKRMTRDPVDLQVFDSAGARIHSFVFLWRDDVSTLYDLDKCREEQTRRILAVNRLKGRFRTAHVRRKMQKSPRHAVSILLTGLSDSPIGADPSWVVGGPLRENSVSRLALSADEYRERSKAWDIMRAYTSRPFLGFAEVGAKTWLEKFKGTKPPPDDTKSVFIGMGFRASRSVYSVATLEKIK